MKPKTIWEQYAVKQFVIVLCKDKEYFFAWMRRNFPRVKGLVRVDTVNGEFETHMASYKWFDPDKPDLLEGMLPHRVVICHGVTITAPLRQQIEAMKAANGTEEVDEHPAGD